MIRFGVLGAARITPRALVYPCVDEPGASIRVIGARSREKAGSFARCHGIEQVVDDYEAVVAHEGIDAVYIPLPISAHHEWAIKALRAGKHVLCEKSLACNAVEAEAMAAVAAETGLILMDAFHYRYHPVFHRLREICNSGELGPVREIRAKFHVPVPEKEDEIRLNYETGGGVTMDIGCYPISWVRHLTGDEPESVSASAIIGPPDVDVFLATKMTFPGDVKVETSGDMRGSVRFEAVIEVTGERGSVRLINPVVPQAGHRIELTVDGQVSQQVLDRRPTYGYQLDAFMEAVKTGIPPLTGHDDAVRQMRVIDRCYEAAGLPLRGDRARLESRP